MKLQVHTAANEAHLEHGTAPGRAGDDHLNRLRDSIADVPEISTEPSPRSSTAGSKAHPQSAQIDR